MMLFQRICNLLFIFVLSGVLLGAYSYEYFEHEEPCPLCLLQRLGMLSIAVALLMNLRFGVKVEHYGLALLSAVLGRLVSLRQINLHVCPEFPVFGNPVLGFDLYVWAFIVFTCSIVSCAILLIIYGYSKHREYPQTWGCFEKIAFCLVAFLVIGNMLTSFVDCGLSACD